MELIIALVVSLIVLIIIYYVFNINIKQIKEIKENRRLKELTDRFPENEKICKDILKMLNNEKVKIKQNEDSNNKTSLYIAITDTILIANIKDIYTRIQTIAHECVHSIQDRRILLFNFFYTNIYNLYFVITIILTILGVFKNYNIQIFILLIMGILFYIVRSYLETDAMIRAEYVAKDYMEKYIKENNVCNKEAVDEIIEGYKNINKIGIPMYNFILFTKTISKVIIYIIISLVVMAII